MKGSALPTALDALRVIVGDAGPDPSNGPTPSHHLLGSRTRPANPLGGVGSDNMIPAPVRSVPQTDRWCLRLLTIMQRGCDTSTPLWRRGRSPRGCCERVSMPIVGRHRFQNTANQELGALAMILHELVGCQVPGAGCWWSVVTGHWWRSMLIVSSQAWFHHRPGEVDKCAQSPLTLRVKPLCGTPGFANTHRSQVRGPCPTSFKDLALQS